MIRNLSISGSGIRSIAMAAVFGILLFSPDAKSWLTRGMMQLGFFQFEVKSLPGQAVSPNFLFKNEQGQFISSDNLRGKVVFINFWASWCPPCRAEMPSIEKLYLNFKSNPDIVFLVVNVDENFAKSRNYLKKKELELPLYVPAGDIPETLLNGSIPTTVIINKAGKVVNKHTGAANFASPKVRRYLQDLIEE